MFKTLQKIGNSKGIVLTRDMLAHLGVTDAVDVVYETGRLVITAPKSPGLRQSFEEALSATTGQYGDALRRLADVSGSPME